MPYQREAEIVLAMWRDIQRERDTVDRGSPEAVRLEAESERLREEYQRLIALARRHHRPEPKIFPEIEDRPRAAPGQATDRPATVLIHADGRFLEANDRFCEITGYAPDEVTGLHVGDLSASRERKAAIDVWRGYVAGKVRIRVGRLHNLRRKDGAFVWTRSIFLGPAERPDAFESRWVTVSPTEIVSERPATLQTILTARRETERLLNAMSASDPGRAALERKADDLRDLYRAESSIRSARTRP